MEKDIEILEDMRDNIYGAMQFEDDYQVTELEEKQFNALNLAIKSINRVKELEDEDVKIRAKFILSLQDYIPKSKIKEKIEELEKNHWHDGYLSKFDKYAIQVLQDLLKN